MYKNAKNFIDGFNESSELVKFIFANRNKEEEFEKWVIRNNPNDAYTKQVIDYCMCFGTCSQYIGALYQLPARRFEKLVDCIMSECGYNMEAGPLAKMILKEVWKYGYEL